MENKLKLQDIPDKVSINGVYLSTQVDGLQFSTTQGLTINKEAIVMMAEVTPAPNFVKAINLTFNNFFLELNFTHKGLDEFARIVEELGLDSDPIANRFEHITINVR